MRNNEKGQAIILVVVALGIFLIGGIGFAIDGAQIYAHREMAQAAADSAAQAGVFSIFAGTGSTGFPSPHVIGTAYTCTASDTSSPCLYAQKNGFGLSADDVVAVSFPSSPYNGVPGTPNTDYPFPFVQVSISRTVNTALMRFLGTSSSTFTVVGGAGIVQSSSPVPIIVLHPTMSGALSLGGASSITICGGPSRGIQVNSSSRTAVSVGHIDLSHAGPLDTGGNCATGTGADFGNFGGPATKPGNVLLGSGHYVQPAAPIGDPFASVPEPTKPAAHAADVNLADGVGGCPASPKKGCVLHSPGYYSTDLQIKNETGIFKPGLYYIDGDFSNAANGDIFMCQNTGGVVCGTPGLTGNTGTGNGVTVYLHGTHSFDFGANSDLTLVGSDNASTYKGIVFFSDRTAAANSHNLGGGGATNLTGTVYLVNPVAVTRATPSRYQTLNLGGGSGSGTSIRGEIVVDAISMSGNSSVTMNLDPSYKLPIDQVALIK